jgi:hypothetical protein
MTPEHESQNDMELDSTACLQHIPANFAVFSSHPAACKEMACLMAHQLWMKHELELIGASVTSCFKHADNNYNHKIDDLLSLRFFALLAIVLIRV